MSWQVLAMLTATPGDQLPELAQPENVLRALRRANVTGVGCVRDVTVESARTTILSRIIRLPLSHDGSIPGAPAVDISTFHPSSGGTTRSVSCSPWTTSVAVIC